jgi:hypothetical protein
LRIDIFHKIAAYGLVLGIFGAGILYWETVVSDQDLEIVAKGIALYRDTKLSLGEIVQIIVWYKVAFGMLFMIVASIVLTHKFQPNALKLPYALSIGIFFCSFTAFPLFYYLLLKMLRRVNSRWFERLESLRLSQNYVTRNDEIKRILRVIGFATLWLAGVAQLPATIYSA